MNRTTRIKKLEQEASRHKQVVRCAGLVGGPKSERDYQEYLEANIDKPFIWINFLRKREKPPLRGWLLTQYPMKFTKVCRRFPEWQGLK
jgi:hypothetical protein